MIVFCYQKKEGRKLERKQKLVNVFSTSNCYG